MEVAHRCARGLYVCKIHFPDNDLVSLGILWGEESIDELDTEVSQSQRLEIREVDERSTT